MTRPNQPGDEGRVLLIAVLLLVAALASLSWVFSSIAGTQNFLSTASDYVWHWIVVDLAVVGIGLAIQQLNRIIRRKGGPA